MEFVKPFLVSLGVMAVFDGIWLSLAAPRFYKKYIGFIMAESPAWWAAILFYLIYTVAVTYLIVLPGWQEGKSLAQVAVTGAIFGLAAYATYDLTNQATLKNWPITVTVVDLIWGTFLTASVSVLSVIILRAIGK